MSKIALCPTCHGKAKIKADRQTGETSYSAIQDEEAFKKIGQLKKALQKSMEKAKALEEELAAIKAQARTAA